MVLQMIAAKLVEGLTGREVACCYGGEEFMVLIPDATIEVALATAERLRAAISAWQVRYGDATLPLVTISAGVAAYAGPTVPAQELLRRADEALYRVKEAGRNCARAAAS